MKEIYNSAKICPYGQKPYDPHVQRPYDNTRPQIIRTNENFNPEMTSTNVHQVFNRQFDNQESEYPNYCDMQLDPEISRILAHSRIESELVYVWKSFRDTTGPKLKNRFMRYIQLANNAAVSSGN